MTGQEICTRYDRMKARRQQYETALQDCAQYIRPLRATIGSPVQEASITTNKVYDSTAMDANRKLGSRITGTLCNRGLSWFGVRVRDERVNTDRDARRWLDAAAESMLLAYAQSQFYAEICEALTDLPGLGTGGIFCDELPQVVKGFNGLHVRACGVGELAIDEGDAGLVDVVAREFQLSARAAKAKWETGLSRETETLVEKEPEKTVKFLHFVEPRPSVKPPKVDAEGKSEPVASTRLPWACYYLELEKQHVIAESGYHEIPYAIARWSRPAGDLYGRGIGHDVLPTVQTLNEAVRLWLEYLPYSIKPPLTALMNAVQGPIRWVPGGRTDVRRHDAIMEHPPQRDAGNLEPSFQRMQQKIEDMFFTQEFSLRESSRMTTVEVYARLELMQQLIGPNVSRIMHELLNRITERTFGILLRAGAFPPVPPILQEYIRKVGIWDIEYQSPLERAQRAPELQALERTLAAIGGMQPVYPEVKDVLKADDTIRHIADVSGVPARLVRTDREVAEIRMARIQAQEEAAAMQQANLIADSMGKAAPMVKALQQPGNGGAA